MDEALREAEHHRVALRVALDKLEAALALPALRNEWLTNVTARLKGLSSAFQNHVQVVESPEGLFVEITEAAPQLSDKIARLRREHDELSELLDGVIRSVAEDADDPAESMRELCLSMMGKFVRHRQHGADLVFDAYDVEIGGSD